MSDVTRTVLIESKIQALKDVIKLIEGQIKQWESMK